MRKELKMAFAETSGMVFMTAMSGNVAIQKRSISATLHRERLSLVVPGHRSSRECRPRAKACQLPSSVSSMIEMGASTDEDQFTGSLKF